MSTNMRSLLCEGVLIWIPSDLSDGELSNEYQHEGSIVCEGDDMGMHRICLTESFQISHNMRGLLCEGVM